MQPTLARQTLLAAVLLLLPAAARSYTEFDLGRRETVRIAAPNDSTCFEEILPDAFGEFPTGSWVWEEVLEIGCDAVRWPDQVCWNGAFVRGFQIEFNDGGCGCGGFLWTPTTIQFTWTDALLGERGISESALVLVYHDPTSRAWQYVDDATFDIENNRVTLSWDGDILGIRQYAIVTSTFTATVSTTWGGIKARHGR